MFNTGYSVGLGALVPIELLYSPLFTLSGARQSIRKLMRAHLEYCLFSEIEELRNFLTLQKS